MRAQRLPTDILGVIARTWAGRALSYTCRALNAIAPDPVIWVEDVWAICECGCVPPSRVMSARLPNGAVHGSSVISCGIGRTVKHDAWHHRNELVSITSHAHGNVYARVDVVGSRIYEWYAFSKKAYMRRQDRSYRIWIDVSLRDYDMIIDRAIDRDSRRPASRFTGDHICEVGCIALLPQCVLFDSAAAIVTMIADILTHIMNVGAPPFGALNGIRRSSKRFSCWPIDRASYVVETKVDEPWRYTLRAYPNGYRISAIIGHRRTADLSANYENNVLRTIMHKSISTLAHVKAGALMSWCDSVYNVWVTSNGVRHVVIADLTTGLCQYMRWPTCGRDTSKVMSDSPIAQTVLSLMRAGDMDAACDFMAKQFGVDETIAEYVADTLCEVLR